MGVEFMRWTNLSVTEEGELWWSHSKPHAYPPEFSGHAGQEGRLSSQRRRRSSWSWGVSLGSVYPGSWGTDNTLNYSLCISQCVRIKHLVLETDSSSDWTHEVPSFLLERLLLCCWVLGFAEEESGAELVPELSIFNISFNTRVPFCSKKKKKM